MGLLSRTFLFFRVKTRAALDKAEDPRQVMDYAYEQQQSLLRKVKLGLVEVATSKRRLEQESQRQRARIPELEGQARQALGLGREDLARIALQRKQTALAELAGLDQQVIEVAQEEHRLSTAGQELSARIEEFRTHRAVMTARYTAAEAQVRVNEALTGVSDELGELTIALCRAEEKTHRMQARASAIDVLIDTGELSMPLGNSDSLGRELRQLTSAKAVDAELAALKAQDGAGPRLLGPKRS